MRIDNKGPIGGIRASKSKNKTDGGGSSFSVDEEPAMQEANTPTATANITDLNALLSLQNVDDHHSGKRRTAERGFDLLDRLEEMRHGLLLGKLSGVQVNRIAQKVKTLGRTGDEKLDSILADIDMRARVELAKLGIYEL